MKEEKKKTTTGKGNSSKNTAKKTSTKKTTTSAKKSTSSKTVKTGAKKKITGTIKVKSTSTKSKTAAAKNKVETVKPIEEIKEPAVEEVKKVSTVSKEETVQNPRVITTLQIVAIVLMVILVIVATAKIFYEYQESSFERNGYQESYLIKKKNVSTTQCGEIANAINRDQAFIYIPNLGTEEEFELEKKLADVISDYHLEDDFYVLSGEPHNCGEISDVTSEFSSELQLTSGITKTPVILFYRNGELAEVIEREDEAMLTDGDLVKVLDIYEIKP